MHYEILGMQVESSNLKQKLQQFYRTKSDKWVLNFTRTKRRKICLMIDKIILVEKLNKLKLVATSS